MLFFLIKQGCASRATELLEFFEEMEWDFSKKTQKIWFRANDQLWFGVQFNHMDANCLLSVQTSWTLSVIWKFWKITKKKCISWTLFFNKIMLLCINRSLWAISSKKTSRRYWNGQHTVQIWILLKIYGDFEATITKTDSFLGKFRRKSKLNLELNWHRHREKPV